MPTTITGVNNYSNDKITGFNRSHSQIEAAARSSAGEKKKPQALPEEIWYIVEIKTLESKAGPRKSLAHSSNMYTS